MLFSDDATLDHNTWGHLASFDVPSFLFVLSWRHVHLMGSAIAAVQVAVHTVDLRYISQAQRHQHNVPGQRHGRLLVPQEVNPRVDNSRAPSCRGE